MSGNDTAVITVAIPCRNEERYIFDCLNSVLGFELPYGIAMEILVVDGMSTDRTCSIVSQLAGEHENVRMLVNPGEIQSCALNIAIREAKGAWLLRLDAHSTYPANYLLKCYETSIRTGAANVGGLFITFPGGDGYQASLVQALTTHFFGIGNAGFRTNTVEGEKDTVPFGFFNMKIFEEIGLFDERLVRTQDYEFNSRIIASGRRIWLNPEILVHYRNIPTLLSFYRKQLFRQAPYNAYLWYLAPYAFAPRHSMTVLFTTGLLVGSALVPLGTWTNAVMALFVCLYVLLAVAASVQQAIRYRKLGHVLFLPPCFFLYHFLHGLGVLSGLIRICFGTAPVQKQPRPWPGARGFRPWPPGGDACAKAEAVVNSQGA